MSRGSLRSWAFGLAAASSAAISLTAGAVPITADSFVYTPGAANTNFENPSAALGNLNGNTGFGGLNPYNPAFSPNDIVWVGPGGSLTLHLSGPVAANGFNLGVYSNVGMTEAAGGAGTSTDPAANFNQASVAVVSISQDGVNFVPLNGGNPITFSNPTNYYTDKPIVSNFQALGTAHASQSKPFLQGISSFNGSTYDQIKATLNNSAGGTWLNLRNSGIAGVNYVKFDVAANSTNRMVVDAIGGIGAVNTLVPNGRVISESVGSGANTSDVLVDFGPRSFDFQVHYTSPSITVEQALQLVQGGTDFRYTVQQFGTLPDGVTPNDFLTGIDYGGYVKSGLGSNNNDYFGEYVGNGTAAWNFGNGISVDTLTNGSYAGFAWAQANPGAPNFDIIPEPTTGTLAALSLLVLCRRRRK
jgi:hypothetical protein